MQVSERLLITTGNYQRGYPEIQLPSDINIEQLTEGDDNPMFVTWPVMRTGAVSRNTHQTPKGRVNRRYGRDAAIALMNSINQSRPSGQLGHPDAGRRSERAAALRWLAAEMDEQGTVWGKAYILPHRADLRNDIRTAMASNALTATSLWGSISGIKEDGEVVGLIPTNIDIVDPNEAGILELGHIPHVTRETVEEETMTETVSELLVQRDNLQVRLSDVQGQLTPLQETLQTIREMVGGDDVVVAVRAMIEEVTSAREQQRLSGINDAIAEALGDISNNEEGSALIREMVGSVQTPEAATTRVQELLGMDHVQKMLKALVVGTSGGVAIIGKQQDKDWRKDVAENAENLAKQYGL